MFHLLTRTVKDRAGGESNELRPLERQREYQLRGEMSSGKVRLEKTREGHDKCEFLEMVKAFRLEHKNRPSRFSRGDFYALSIYLQRELVSLSRRMTALDFLTTEPKLLVMVTSAKIPPIPISLLGAVIITGVTVTA